MDNTVDSSPKDLGALDWFRLAAALLVVTIHTTPFAEISWKTELFLTGIFARTAVPFFFAVSGYFADFSSAAGLKKLVSRIAVIYGIATVLYLPLGTYRSSFREILFEGTYYHLWYLPACIIGSIIVFGLKKLPAPAAFSIAAVLYIIGLFGDSYYGLISGIEPLRRLYGIFSKVFLHTRNGIFTAPIFILCGNVLSGRPPTKRRDTAIMGTAVSVLLLITERLLLGIILIRLLNCNMFIFLIPLTFFLLQLLTSVKAKPRPFVRTMSMWVYIIHPIIIYDVYMLGVENHLLAALIVMAVSLLFSAVFPALIDRLKAVRRQSGTKQP